MFATDLDDTLFDEIDYVRSGYRAIGKELELHGIMSSCEVVNMLETAVDTAHGFDNLAARIWLDYPGTSFNVEWMVEVYRTHTPDIELRSGVYDTLRSIYDAGHKIGLITDGRSGTQRAKIKALGLDRFILPENIIISSEIGADKTTRKPFDILMSRNPEEKKFLYIGDNPAKDFHWPNVLGWYTVEVSDRNGTNIHPQDIDVPEEYRAKNIVLNYADVLALEGKF